jgi:serine/threonine protein kinase
MTIPRALKERIAAGLLPVHDRPGDKESKSPSQAADAKEYAVAIDYHKGRMIGQGSFGKVYFGVNKQSGQLVAIKSIPITDDNDTSLQFQQIVTEVQSMERLRHTNVVSILGVEKKPKELNIVMEYIAGRSLDDLIKSVGILSEDIIRTFKEMTNTNLYVMSQFIPSRTSLFSVLYCRQLYAANSYRT